MLCSFNAASAPIVGGCERRPCSVRSDEGKRRSSSRAIPIEGRPSLSSAKLLPIMLPEVSEVVHSSDLVWIGSYVL